MHDSSNEGIKWLQVRLDKALWKSIAGEALEREMTVSDLVRGVLEERFGKTPKTPVSGEMVGGSERGVVERDTTGRTRGMRGRRAVEADAPEAVQVSNPAPATTLKEDHGWCKVCHVNQVKLPGLVCKECLKV